MSVLVTALARLAGARETLLHVGVHVLDMALMVLVEAVGQVDLVDAVIDALAEPPSSMLLDLVRGGKLWYACRLLCAADVWLKDPHHTMSWMG